MQYKIQIAQVWINHGSIGSTVPLGPRFHWVHGSIGLLNI